MNSDPEYDALDLLLIDLFELGLDPARMNQLSALLAVDPAARARYIDRSMINALLEWQAGRVDFSMRQIIPSPLRTDLSRAMILPAITDSLEQEPEEVEPNEATEYPRQRLPDRQTGSARRWLRILSLAAAVLIAISISAVMFVHARRGPRIVGMLTGADDVQWQPGLAPQSGSAAIAEHEKLSLLSGSVKIDFNGGASVSIQAPAQFSADTSGTMTITSGRLAAVVPERARGFTVSTPDAIVKDLGTEFGVTCGPTIETEIQVFRGTVQASLRSGQGSTVTLSAGDTARVSAGALTTSSGGASIGTSPHRSQGANLPPGYHDKDVGGSAVPGAAEYSAATGHWTISGIGHDTWLTHDRFHMVEKQMKGDAAIVCRILTPTTEADGSRSGASKCGIMFRASLDSESQFVSVVFTESLGVQMLSRDVSATNVITNGVYATSAETPLWLKLNRAGDMFTGSYSLDGIKWVTVSAHVVHMPATLHVGLMLSSHKPGHVGTATFSDVSIKSDGPAQ